MSVKFTQEVENQRMKVEQALREKIAWDLFKSTSLVLATKWAKENGWKEKKVQIRVEEYDGLAAPLYIVEPFEEGCGCRGLLKYEDFFL